MSSDNNQNILGYDSANNKFASTNVVANRDGSMIERQEYLMDQIEGAASNYNSQNYGSVAITFVAGTTGSVASHEILTVTGLVRLKIWAECTVNLAGATATIELGDETTSTSLIAQTTATDIDAGELWYDATPTTAIDTSSTVILDKVVNALDIGYTVGTAAISAGAITFHYVWEPLNATGAVVAADGTGTL
jgi:hypothetical protein